MSINPIDSNNVLLDVAPGTGLQQKQDHGSRASQALDGQKPDSEKIKEMITELQLHIDSIEVSLQFSTYGKGGEKVAVAVVNKDTGEVVREIPPKELQTLYDKMSELVGIIFNKNA